MRRLIVRALVVLALPVATGCTPADHITNCYPPEFFEELRREREARAATAPPPDAPRS